MVGRTPITSALLTVLALVSETSAGPLASAKRGLVFTPNSTFPQDNYVWRTEPSDLTWYYNYGASPSSVFKNWTQDQFEFVPMLWGAPAEDSDTTFYTTVKSLVTDQKLNITHVLAFNEPDGPAVYGGSEVSPAKAAAVWVNNFIPLQSMGIKLGLPACTGSPSGLPWLQQFLANCSSLISTDGETKNCTYDFLPIHWYDNFEGLASHIGERVAAFPNTSIWVTEYNYAHQSLPATQSFYNMSAEYFDRLPYVERYSLFGAFRADVANVGANGAMLSSGGQLTDIGAWYLGRDATGVEPTTGKPGSNAGARHFAAHLRVVLAAPLAATLVLLSL